MASGHTPHEEHDDHGMPLRTTAQGTQFHSVEQGHEESDASIGQVVKWLAVTLLVVVVSQVVIWGAYEVWLADAKRVDAERMPSAIFSHQEAPPLPRVLPNAYDAGQRPLDPLQGPGEYLVEYREREDRALTLLGLFNPGTGRSQLPGAATQRVLSGAGAAPDDRLPGLPAPSDSSGGTMMENKLQ